jgi:hypothetical protein
MEPCQPDLFAQRSDNGGKLGPRNGLEAPIVAQRDSFFAQRPLTVGLQLGVGRLRWYLFVVFFDKHC